MLGKCPVFKEEEYLYIVGIHSEVKDETLEEGFMGIFDKLDCSNDEDHIEACTWVS